MNDTYYVGSPIPGTPVPGSNPVLIQPVPIPTTGFPRIDTVPLGTPWAQPGVGFPPPGSLRPYAVPMPQQERVDQIMEDMAQRTAAARKDAAMLGESGYERIEAELYQTPPENVDVLLEFFQPITTPVWEPACGEGYISKRLMALGYETWSSDLHDYGWGTPNTDFLKCDRIPNPNIRTIITNPPYIDGLAEEFVRHALKLTETVKGQVAMFLRNEFDCGKGRMDLFNKPPYHAKIIVTKRPRWIAGSTGSPRHNYAWFVWDWRHVRGPGAAYYQHPSLAKPIHAPE